MKLTMADNERSVYNALNNYRNVFGVPSRNRIICVIVFILFILTLAVITFSLLGKPSEIGELDSYTNFKSALNTSVDPCFDFYHFSCGSWSEQNPVDNYRPRTTTFSILQDSINQKKRDLLNNAQEDPDLPLAVNSAIRFYNTCVQSNDSYADDYAVVTDYLSQIGGWPISDENDWDESRFDWLNATAFYSKKFGINIVFDSSLTRDLNKNIIFIGQPRFNNIFQAMFYVILIKINYSHIDHITEVVTKTNSKWKEYLYDSVNVTDMVTITVEDLINQFPDIDWLRYFYIMYHKDLTTLNKTLSLQDVVVVRNMEYLRIVEKVLNSDTFSKFELANLFGSVFVLKHWILIPGVLKTYAAIYGYDAETELDVAKDNCFNLVDNLFACSLDYLYIRSLPSREIKDTKTLTSYIKIAFHNVISHSDWLDKESKVVALNTLDRMKEIIGFPSYLNDKAEFNLRYKDFPVVSRNILEAYLKIQDYFTYARDWILPRPVTDVSAYYKVGLNTIVFPISLHNPPFFYENGPSYLNFGAIGSVIAHEMMHAFGSFDDGDIVYSGGFATNSSTACFKNRTRCFVEQYDKYDASGSYKNNGTATLRENIADSEGLRIAFEAYKKYNEDFGHIYHPGNFTPDQMFFISFGNVWCSKYVAGIINDHHSIPVLRLNEAVSNLKSFAVAFSCPENSPMNPTKRCTIW